MTSAGPVLTSLANPRVKAAVRLRDRRQRDETGLTIVDGAREIRRAIDAGVAIEEAFVCPPLIASAEARETVERLASTGATVHEVSEPVLGKIAFGDRSDGVVAVVRIPDVSLAALTLPSGPLVVVVEAVEKPGNVGAILRTADGAGVNAVIAADLRTDLFNPNAIRASLGTIFSTPVAAAASGNVLDFLSERSIRPIAARVDAPTLYTEADLTGPVAIVLGSEAGGLTAQWEDPRVTSVRIPMRGAADSLNVSAAAAVLLYEALRQRS